MSYTINPNAKNKWARNAENTMDLSLETDASSVYLDNGRTLEQEIGEGSMVSNIATVDSAMSKVIDGTLDGAYESLVFKGKSLINFVRLNSKITSDSPIDINILPIDHTKTYLLKVRVNEAPTFTNESDGQMALKVQYFSTSDTKGFTAISNSNMVKGYELTKIVAPTLESNTNGKFSLWIPRYISGTLDVDVMFIPYQEGMEEWDIPYFEGLCDVKMPILRNVGKNLLSIQDYSPKGTLTNVEVTRNTLKATVEGVWHGFEYILQLKPNTEYTFSFERDSDTVKGYIRHPENKGWTGGYGGYSNYTFTTRDTGVIRFTIESSLANNTIVVRNPMIVEGNLRPTSYENYKTNILRTSEEIVLREVNGVQDTYNPLTGEYVRRIGEKVFDGSQTIAFSGGDHNTVVQFYYADTTVAKTNDGSIVKVLCNNFPTYAPNDVIGKEVEGVTSRRGDNQGFYFSISKTKIASRDTVLIKSYLQQNPITVQYELAEPITTIVEPLTIPFAYENGHVILESGSEEQSLLPTLEYSTVVNKTGLVENVAKTIQAQEKQLTKLEQMLIQNIINLDYNNTLLTLKNEMEEML